MSFIVGEDVESLAVTSNVEPWNAGALPIFSAVNASTTPAEAAQVPHDPTYSNGQQQQQASSLLPHPVPTKSRLQDHCKDTVDVALNAHKQRRLPMVDCSGVADFRCVPQRRRVSAYAGLAPSSRSSKHALASLDSQLYLKRSGGKAEAAAAAAAAMQETSSSRAAAPSAQARASPGAVRGHGPAAAKQNAQKHRSSSRASCSRSPSMQDPKQALSALPPPSTSESPERTHRGDDSRDQNGSKERAVEAGRSSSVVVVHTPEVLPPTTPQKWLSGQELQQQQQKQGSSSDVLSPVDSPRGAAAQNAISKRQLIPSATLTSQTTASKTNTGDDAPTTAPPTLQHPRLPSFRRINSRVSMQVTNDELYSASKAKRRHAGEGASTTSTPDDSESRTGHPPVRRMSSLKTLSIVWAKRPYDPSSASHRALQQRRQQQQKLQEDRRDKRTQWKLTSPSKQKWSRKDSISGQPWKPRKGRESLSRYEDQRASKAEVFEERGGTAHEELSSLQREEPPELAHTHADSLRRSLEAVLARHGVDAILSPRCTPHTPYVSPGKPSATPRPSSPVFSSTYPVEAANEYGHRAAFDEETASDAYSDLSSNSRHAPTAGASHFQERQPLSPAPPVRQRSMSGPARTGSCAASTLPTAKAGTAVERLPPLVPDNTSSRRSFSASPSQPRGSRRKSADPSAKAETQSGVSKKKLHREVRKEAGISAGRQIAEPCPDDPAVEKRSTPPGNPAVAPVAQRMSPRAHHSPYKNGNAGKGKAHHLANAKRPPFRVPAAPLSRPPRHRNNTRKQRSNSQRLSYSFAPYMPGMPSVPGGRVRCTPTIGVYSHQNIHPKRRLKQSSTRKKQQPQCRAPELKPIDYTALTTQADPLDYLLGRHGFWGESTTR